MVILPFRTLWHRYVMMILDYIIAVDIFNSIIIIGVYITSLSSHTIRIINLQYN